jgi:hypothetical protein
MPAQWSSHCRQRRLGARMGDLLWITRGKPPAGYLQIRDADVEKHPVDAVDLRADVTMQHVVESPSRSS